MCNQGLVFEVKSQMTKITKSVAISVSCVTQPILVLYSFSFVSFLSLFYKDVPLPLPTFLSISNFVSSGVVPGFRMEQPQDCCVVQHQKSDADQFDARKWVKQTKICLAQAKFE